MTPGLVLVAGTLSFAPSAQPQADPDKVVHIRNVPALNVARRLADPAKPAFGTLYLLTEGGAHAVAFVTDHDVTLVNSKQAGWGRAAMDAIERVTRDPVTTIINTEPDAGCTGGNGEIPTVVEIVAHGNTRAAMAKMPTFMGANARFLPGRTFTDTMSLGDGRDRVDLYHFGRAHTDGDTVVVFPGFGVAYLGELFPSKSLPVIDTANGGSAVAFPETLAHAVAALGDIEVIIPGRAALVKRGETPTGWMPTGNALSGWLPTVKDLQEYADFNRDFLEAVKEAMRAGKSPDATAAGLKMPEKYAAYEMGRARANIQAIYDELSQ